jgi:periplasmic protein TonB
MKRGIKLSTGTRVTLVLFVHVAALIFVVAACGKTSNSGTEGGVISAVQPVPPPTKTDIPFVQVDEMPVFPGGDEGILKYITENTTYPEIAKKNNITGKVIVRFIVEKDCSVSDATIIKSVDPLLDAEAIKVISSLPKFEKPAKNGGVAVRVYYMVPIAFALK